MDIRKKQHNYISKIVFLIWVIIVLITLWLMRANLAEIININVRYIRLLELTTFLLIVGECCLMKYGCKNFSETQKAVIIFSISFLVRIVLLPFSQYIPTSDFRNYYIGACHFVASGYEGGVYSGLVGYGIPSFAGQAIINGIFLSVLSPTLLGMQLLNSLYTAGICVLIYLIGKMVDTEAAIMGAILYTFYPISILSTQITSNHHGAGFYMMLAIYLYFKVMEKKSLKIGYLFGCAVCMVISNYYHPSIIIMQCALIVYVVVYSFEVAIDKIRSRKTNSNSDNRKLKCAVTNTLIIMILYTFIWEVSMGIIIASGYAPKETSITPLSKIAVGFNFETRGKFSDDYGYIKSFPEEQQARAAIGLALERINEHGAEEALELMFEKNQNAWFASDNYFNFYQYGIRENLLEKIDTTTDSVLKANYEEELQTIKYFMADIMITDNVFVIFIWILALVGIVGNIFRFETGNMGYMLMYIPLGWMAFIMITELQSRYRYQSMPIVILLAGFGIGVVKKYIKIFITKYNEIKKQ